MGDRKEGDGEVEGTNERTNTNYILEKCNYRTVYSIFVDVDPSISSQDCDYAYSQFASVPCSTQTTAATRWVLSLVSVPNVYKQFCMVVTLDRAFIALGTLRYRINFSI